MSDSDLASSTTPDGAPGEAPGRRWVVTVTIGGGLLLILAAVISFLAFLVRIIDGTDPGMPVSVIKVVPTVASPLPIPGCETVISSGEVRVAAPLPISLAIADRSFAVSPVPPSQGQGMHPPTGPGTAAWFCGTVVNYVVELEPTAENATLLSLLAPGDEMGLSLTNGAVLLFRFAEWREAGPDEPSLFAQTAPRLTLILSKEEGGWQVATAEYSADVEPALPSPDTLAQPGQTVQVGGVGVTLARGYAVRDDPGLLPGTMYYVVEFSVQNGGPASLNAGAFDLQLQDALGNRYLLSPRASAATGGSGLSGSVAPGATMRGSVAYEVPEALPGPSLIWVFRPLPGSDLHAIVRVPYEYIPPEPVASGRAEVVIDDAFVDDGVLFIEGLVRNMGNAPLTVEQGDISLTSTAGTSSLRMAAPPLPWEVEPGQTQFFELQYAKPAAPSAGLSLAGYLWAIEGLDDS